VDSLRELHGDGPQDDLTLLEVTVSAQLASVDAGEAPQRQRRAASNWQVNFDLSAHTLRQVDPVPLLMRVLSEIQGLERHKEILYTVLAELVANALDHGILQLDSALKASPAGFASYYGERDARLARLESGHLRVALQHAAHAGGGRLTITMEDSGAGFDYKAAPPGSLDTNRSASGRGIRLLRTLCEKIEYSGNGNRVEAVFVWKL
jgi:anti-sigma regulatory factor (Ser/Thr protein kinase)